MNSSKKGASHLTAVLKKKGVNQIVLCPGSRNSPLIISFLSDDYFSCYSIVDERSAGFFALGIAQKTQSTVAVVCTSGSALLNLAPAVAETYYQRIPLLVISADRPNEWLGQGESQTINQKNIFQNFVRASFDLVQEPKEKDELWYHDRQVSEAIEKTIHPFYGPVHLNIRFKEPLYEKTDDGVVTLSELKEISVEHTLSSSDAKKIVENWNSSKKVLIICGQSFPNQQLNEELNKLAKKNVVVLTESTSNVHSEHFFPCIDKMVMPNSKEEKDNLKPDLLLTIGGPLISRKVKQYLREYSTIEHWHIDPIDTVLDAFQTQTLAFPMKPESFLSLLNYENSKDDEFFNRWRSKKEYVEKRHDEYVTEAVFSDLKAFDYILDSIPDDAILHVGNSSSIRYVQLFDKKRQNENYCNRGTSGIEGSLSTAVGSSQHHKGSTVLITGDLSTLYDSNGLWNNYLKPNFKLIVINNNGGGIFRIIEGPSTVDKFEEYIETNHDIPFKKLAELYDLDFYSANNESDLKEVLSIFMNKNEKASILEINTPKTENDKVLKNYFDYLKET